ncbi:MULTISPECIES: hypothetical protein [Sphingobacterium]|uniref:hypothetical protein n=1 Tax=Sphingobacterium TaxID=28453 RepID=UPI000C0BD6F6|nr:MULTISPECIES: hypothetical protein [Sphingobacterium]VTP98053.1 Uncharacterised protein [Sphingobacterium daejeonense]
MINSDENKKKNKLNDDDQGPRDPNNLAYDSEEDSYELDVNDRDPDWEHPSDYDTISEGAADDDSTYDSANPYVGDEYAPLEELREENLDDNNMHIEGESIVRVSKEDEELSRDAEDYRDDLDEEGYPKNDE